MANEFKVKKGLIVDGSNTVLDIQGTQGQLFSVTDSLTGDLFSVSDVSGIPILNVNSSGSVKIDGNLGINATPTTNAIEIDGADGTSYVYFKSDAATTGARVGLNGDDLIIENKQASGDMIFDTNSTERLRIASGGGTTFASNVEITGDSASPHTDRALIVNRGQDGSMALQVLNSGEVVTNANYFYATGPGVSMYVQNTAVFRGSIVNDTSNAPVTIGDDLTVTGNTTLSSAAPILYLDNTTSTTGKNWRLSSAANGKMYIAEHGVVDAITLEHTSGNATFAGSISPGGELSFSNNNFGVTMKDASGTSTRVFRLNSGNVMYIGPIDTYAGGQIFYGAAEEVTGHKFHVGGAAKLTIDSSGNSTFAGRISVGGTHTANSQVHIKNTSGDNRGLLIENLETASYAEVAVKSDLREFRLGTGGDGTNNANAENLFYIYDATTGGAAGHRFEINSNGDVQARRPRSNTAGDVALSVQPTDSTIHYGFRIDSTTNSFNLDRVDSAGQLLRVDASGNATFSGDVYVGGLLKGPSNIVSVDKRLKIADGSEQLNIGQWDGTNHRIEGDANRPVMITSYEGNINLGTSGSTKLNVNTSGISVTGTGTFSGTVTASNLSGTNTGDGASHYSAGDEVFAAHEHEEWNVDSNSNYKRMAKVTVAKNGTATIKFEAYIQSGSYYWSYVIARNNGTNVDLASPSNQLVAQAYTVGLASGVTASVHAYRQYDLDVAGLVAGDQIELWMRSSSAGGAQVTGNGQRLYLRKFRMSSIAPTVESNAFLHGTTTISHVAEDERYGGESWSKYLTFDAAHSGGGGMIWSQQGTSYNRGILSNHGDLQIIRTQGDSNQTTGIKDLIITNAGQIALNGATASAAITLADHTTAAGGIKFRSAASTVSLYSQGSGNLMCAADFNTTGRVRVPGGNAVSDPDFGFSGANAGTGFSRDGQDITFIAGGAEKMRLNSTGNFGVGDAAPSSISANTSSLSVNSSRTDLSGALINKANGTIKHQQYWDSSGYGFNLSANSGDFKWKVNNNDRMVVDKDGGLDIQGTAGQLFSVTNSLTGDLFSVSDVSGIPILNVNSSGLIEIDGDINLGDSDKIQLGASQDLQIFHDGSNSFIRDNGTGGLVLEGSNMLELKARSGEIYLRGNENSSVQLYHNNNIRLNTSNVGVDVTGSLTASGDVVAYSDQRLKTNIKTLDGSRVYKMRGVSFTKDDKEGSGVIAQELEKIAPELVSNDNEYKAVAYGNITGYLIEAIKDLKQEIEELKKQIK